MRIGFISYEYASVASGGGIGTYVRNAARMLADRGHLVEVFCGASTSISPIPGVTVTQVHGRREDFANLVRAPFAARHRESPFDVIEGPEYGADAARIRDDHPDVPLVVRLHTPRCVIGEINSSYVGPASKIRFIAGSLRRGRFPDPFWRFSQDPADPERAHTLAADSIVAPSRAIIDKLAVDWGLSRERCEVVPNVFVPPPALLRLHPSHKSRQILFLGKLEVRKGVIELAHAVPRVARAMPDVRFVFVGRSLPMPGSGRPVGDVMRNHYGRAGRNVRHVDAVPYSEVPAYFKKAAIAVFPSIWENFPNVCLEAMVAGRAVVASSAGGMAEMIEHGRSGLLIPPRDPRALVDAILSLLRDPEKCSRIGLAAREHVVRTYGAEQVAPLHEASLTRAMEARAGRT